MGTVELPNPHLANLETDFLFHLGLSLDKGTAAVFGDVKFVCVGGTPGRMRTTCVRIANEIYGKNVTENGQFDFVFETERYSGYKMGAVLCVNHGIGCSSLSVMLHEVFKLLRYARCSDVTVLRIGTCGGVGVPPGTIVITEESLNAEMKPFYLTSSFGRPLSLPVIADANVINDVISVASNQPAFKDWTVVSAKTYCCDDFYQSQGRLDGSFCDQTESDKQSFLSRLYQLGVRNLEMESAGLLAISHKVGIRAAVLCVTLVDRIQSDQVTATLRQQNDWIDRPIQLVVEYIRSKVL